MPWIRRAGREDGALVARLRRDWTAEQTGERVDDEAFEGVFADWFEREHDQRITWLALDGERPVGMLNMLMFTRMPKPGRPLSRWGYVANVYVDHRCRDEGTGRALLDACLSHAREHHYARLVLSPSERSVPFYLRAGFAPATSLMVHPLSSPH